MPIVSLHGRALGFDTVTGGRSGLALGPGVVRGALKKATVTSAQLLALFATPITIVAAPGAGLAIIPRQVAIHKPAGTAYGGIAAGEDLVLKYTNAAGAQCSGRIESTGFLDQAAAQTRLAAAPVSSILIGSAVFDPASLADGVGTTTTVTVTGAAVGDFVDVSFSLDLQGITVTGWVSAANTVSVRFQNESGGVLDLASGTLTVRVHALAPSSAFDITPIANAAVVLHLLIAEIITGTSDLIVWVEYDVLPTVLTA